MGVVQSNNMQPAALNSHLKDKSYIGGFVPSQADITEFNALGCCPCGEKFPYAARWYCHVASFNVAQRASLPGAASSAAPAAAAPAKAAAADDDDDCDLFGDDDEEEEEAKPACFDGDDDDEDSGGTINLDDLVKFVKGIQMEGLVWGEKHQFADIGYGIKKLQVQCTVVDDLVGVDDLREKIEENEDLVQSCDVVAFNKV